MTGSTPVKSKRQRARLALSNVQRAAECLRSRGGRSVKYLHYVVRAEILAGKRPRMRIYQKVRGNLGRTAVRVQDRRRREKLGGILECNP